MDDHEAIRQLTARYNRAFDDRDVDGWLACFTTDATFEFVGGRTIAGHAALREVIQSSTNDGRHVVTDFIIDVDGHTALQTCQLIELGVDDGAAVVRRFGRYRDELVRTDRWLFSARRLTYG